MNFDESFTRLLGSEGGYSDHPADNGGRTMWGITEGVAIRNGYRGEMRDLSQAFAKVIYKKLYWDAVHADDVPDDLRYSLFDAAVNSGVQQAIKWLQRSLLVPDDGVIGPVTLSAASYHPGYVVAARLNGHRLQFMSALPTWPAFGRGWCNRVAKNLIEA